MIKRVLVLEASKDEGTSIATAVLQAQLDADVYVAHHACEALQLLPEEPAPVDARSVVLVDLDPPFVEADVLVSSLRADAHKSGIPIVALKSGAIDEDVARVIRAGASGCVQKPAERARLDAVVRQVCAYWLDLDEPVPRVEGEHHDDRAEILAELRSMNAALEDRVRERTAELSATLDERRKAEAALRVSEGRYRLIVETAREGVSLSNRDGRFTYTNRRMNEMLGYRPDELVGKHFLEVVADDERPAAIAAFERRRAGVSEGWTCRLKKKEGGEVWARVESTPYSQQGSFAGVLAMVTDVTDERAANDAREKMQAQLILAERLASVGMLAAGVGHEINNPLTYMIWNLDSVARSLERMADAVPAAYVNELEAMLKEARDGAERVARIVKGLKTFAREEDGRRVVLELQATLDLCVGMVANEIRHRARFVRDYGAAPNVEADEARLGQVFINLLVNAAHSIPEGHADSNEIRVATGTDDEGRAFVDVSDTGRGIPEEIRGRIFDPFFTTKEIGAGTGLGLSVSHSIVATLGGEITFRSEVGVGTTFRVSLPAARVRASMVVPKLTSEGPEMRRGRVLVVDDDAVVGRVLALILDEHDVTFASNGHEALELIQSTTPFDVILCDLMMPVMTGIELFNVLVQKRPNMVPRMVFVTGGAFTPAARKFLDEVPNQRLEKPFDVDSVRAVVAAFVRTSRERAEAV